MRKDAVASTITRLEFRREDLPNDKTRAILAATRHSIGYDANHNVQVLEENGTTRDNRASDVLGLTPADFNLEHAPFEAILAFLGNLVFDDADPEARVRLAVFVVDKQTGEPIRANVTILRGASAEFEGVAPAQLEVPVVMNGTVRVEAEGYLPQEHELSLTRERTLAVRLSPKP
jgi:hypothetical protein